MSIQESNKVTLYIATHNKTGKKYFGKTTRYFTEEDLQKNYHGSGKYWKNHIKKHGDDITMEIYGIYSLDENSEDYVKPIAIKFSEENNIVEDYNTWANQKEENGLDGNTSGNKHSLSTRQKISNIYKNKTEEEKKEIMNKILKTNQNKTEEEKKEIMNKILKSKNRIESNGFSVAKNASIKGSITMSIKNGKDLSIREKATLKRKKTNLIIGEDGLNNNKRTSLKSEATLKINDGRRKITEKAHNTKKQKNKEGDSIYDIIGKKCRETRKKVGEDGLNSYERMAQNMLTKYDVYKEHEIIYREVDSNFLNNLSFSLRGRKTFENRLGKTEYSKNKLIKRDKEYLIGLWVKNILN